MRRTSLTVLVQACLFLMAALGSQLLLAQEHAFAAHARHPARSHAAARPTPSNRKPAQRTSPHHAKRTAARPRTHQAPRSTRRAATRPTSRGRTTQLRKSAARMDRAPRTNARPSSIASANRTTPLDLSAQTILPARVIIGSLGAHPAAPGHESASASADTFAGSAPDPAPVVPPAFLSHHAAMPPPLRGSLASLERQNERALAEGLERIADEDDLSDRIAHRQLVPVPVSAELAINADLPEHHRYCRPWTARFLSDLARAHAAQFHAPVEVSSAVRTVAYQRHLIAINGNAAPAQGDIASPHLTGATVDIAKKGMSRQEIGWMRAWLIPLENTGKIDVEEEFQQACFHITVYKSYVPARPAGSVAGGRQGRRGAGQQKSVPAPATDTASATPAPGR